MSDASKNPETVRLLAERHGLSKALKLFPDGVKAAAERGLKPLGELNSAGNRSTILRKTLHHFRRREQDALVIATALGLATIECAAVTDGDENVLQGCSPRMVRMNIAGDDRPDAERLGKIAQACVAARVATLVRTLELDEEALAAECAGQSRGSIRVAHREPVPRAAGEADEPSVQLCEQRRIERGR